MKSILKKLLMPVLALGLLTACDDVPAPYYLLTRQPQQGVIFEESFSNSLGKWTVFNETADGYEWTNNYNTAYISGYQNSVNKATKTWLVSPAIDLTDMEQAYVVYEYVLRFKRTTTKEQLLVSTDYSGDPTTCHWELLDITLKEGTDYTTFSTAGANLPTDVMGQKKVYLAFYYEAPDNEASTWEVRNLSVKEGTYEGESTPEVDAIFFSTLLGETADFTAQPFRMQDGTTFDVWKNSSAYGWVATGYDADASTEAARVYHAGEAWLFSPDIQLPEGDSYLQFMHALNYRNREGLAVYVGVVDGIEEVPGQTVMPNWTELDVAWPAGNNWTYITSGDISLSELAGHKVRFAFKYTGYSDGCATWEIKNFGVYEGTGQQPVQVDTEGSGTLEDPYTVADALLLLSSGAVPSDEVFVRGQITQLGDAKGADLPGNSFGNATYFISDVDAAGAPTGTPLEVYRGYGLGGEHMTKADYIKVGDNVIVGGQLVLFNGKTPEFTQGSKIYELNGKAAPKEDYGTPTGSGTKADPYNVAATIELINKVGNKESEVVYTKGTIVQLGDDKGADKPGNSFGNATYFIADPENNVKLEVYRGFGLGGADIKEGDINVGDEVIVYGKVIYYGNHTREFTQGSKIYSINGKTEDDIPTATPKGSGTLEDPYNAAMANQVASALAKNGKTGEVYIAGKVASIKENYSTAYGNATFYISDDGTTTSQFYVFQALYLGNKKYESGTQLKQGDDVVICGKLTNYQGNTPETSKGEAYLYSLNGQTGGSEPQPQPAGGTYDEPFTVQQAQEAWVDGKKLNTYVTGYIVGFVEGSKYEENALFQYDAFEKAAALKAAGKSAPTNILVSYTPQATSVEQCIPVQLPSGEIRNQLNLMDNSDVLGAEIKLYGSLETFFKVAGIRSTSYAEFTVYDATGSVTTKTIGTRPDSAKKRFIRKKK